MSKLKLLLWSPNGSGLNYGGPGMTAYRLFNANKDDCLKISLVHGRHDQEDYSLFESCEYLGSIESKIHPALNPFVQQRFIKEAKLWMQSEAKKFDVMYGLQGFHVTVLPAHEAEKNGLPAIVKLVQSQSDLVDKKGLKKIFGAPKRRRKLIRGLHGVVSISREITNELLEMGYPEEKIAYIPNGVDDQQFSPIDSLEKPSLKKKLGWKNLPTILFVGAIIPRKQPHLLVQSLKKLKFQGIDAQLVLAGPEKNEEYSSVIRNLIEEYGLKDRVVWSGFKRDIASLYKAADVFSLLSKKEGMPNAMLEAMSSGIPAVVTKVSGVMDAIHHGENGFVVGEKVDESASLFYQLINDPALREKVGAESRATICQKFSSSVIYRQQLELFNRVKNGLIVNAN